MKVGDKIRIQKYTRGFSTYQEDYVIEEFSFCLGIFLCEQDRTAGKFTPLCGLYEPGPESKEEYLPNYGPYYTNLVQSWMDIP